MSIILKTTIAAKVNKRGLEHASIVLEVQLFQNLDSEISSEMDREIIRQTVASVPAWEIISEG